MRNWFQRVFAGRYGTDTLNYVLLILGVIILILSEYWGSQLFMTVAIAVIFITYFRMFSRNISARYAENQKFMAWISPLRKFYQKKFSNNVAKFENRKTHKFVKCQNCKTTLRLPKGKGKIKVTCPKCKHSFVTKT